MQPIGFIITFVCVAASMVIFPEDSGRSASGNARFAWHRFVSVEEYQRRPHENSILDRRPSIHCPRVPEHSADTEPARTRAWVESEPARRCDSQNPHPLGTIAGVGGRSVDHHGCRDTLSWRPKRISLRHWYGAGKRFRIQRWSDLVLLGKT